MNGGSEFKECFCSIFAVLKKALRTEGPADALRKAHAQTEKPAKRCVDASKKITKP